MNWLQFLAEHDHGIEAPPRVEKQLLVAFRKRKMRRRVTWTGAAAAGIAALVPLLFIQSPPALPTIHVKPPPPPVMEARQSRQRRLAGAQRAPREIATEFFPLMEPARPFQRGQLWRVDVPVSAMRSVGLPVREERLNDRIQADVLVGEEGLPRAIRFIGFENR
jgi:hypothetical protein